MATGGIVMPPVRWMGTEPMPALRLMKCRGRVACYAARCLLNVVLPYGGLIFIAMAFSLNLIHHCLGFFRRPLSDACAFLPHDFLRTAYFPVFSRFCAYIAAVGLHQPGLAVVV